LNANRIHRPLSIASTHSNPKPPTEDAGEESSSKTDESTDVTPRYGYQVDHTTDGLMTCRFHQKRLQQNRQKERRRNEAGPQAKRCPKKSSNEKMVIPGVTYSVA